MYGLPKGFLNLKIPRENEQFHDYEEDATPQENTFVKSKEWVDEFNDEKAQASKTLTQEEAEKVKAKILSSVRRHRESIYAIFCGGFRALGFDSFRGFVKSLPLNSSTVYRQKNAAVVELRLGYPIGKIKNESVIRDLYGLDAEKAKLIVSTAQEINKQNGLKQPFPSKKMITQAMIERGFVDDKPKKVLETKELVKLINTKIGQLNSANACKEVAATLKKRYRLLVLRSKNNL